MQLLVLHLFIFFRTHSLLLSENTMVGLHWSSPAVLEWTSHSTVYCIRWILASISRKSWSLQNAWQLELALCSCNLSSLWFLLCHFAPPCCELISPWRNRYAVLKGTLQETGLFSSSRSALMHQLHRCGTHTVITWLSNYWPNTT